MQFEKAAVMWNISSALTYEAAVKADDLNELKKRYHYLKVFYSTYCFYH
jgi:hypothetical protein